LFLVVDSARGERTQRGNLIASLNGRLSPLRLPRDHPAPVSIRLEGGLQTDDGSTLPQVSEVSIGLPGRGTLTTRGLSVCRASSLRDARPPEALARCGRALVGHGRLTADVLLPHQQAFPVATEVLAFNSRSEGRRAVLLHAFAANPPTVVVLPFVLRHGGGRFGTHLVARPARVLGPWPRLARFSLTLSRRYRYRGSSLSYLGASCPIPRRQTAGFFSLAEVTFSLRDGRRIGTSHTSSCRAR
jgi:hypothetical protein